MKLIGQNKFDFIDQTKIQLQGELPGPNAQNLMSPVVDGERYRQVPEDHRVACVMSLIYPIQDALHICYIERASVHTHDKHAGQISFPGGKLEQDDDSLVDCALREVREELGIRPKDIEVLGSLTELYVFASNFLVYPYVGFMDKHPQFIPQQSEVASVISYPLGALLEKGIKRKKDLKVRDYTLKNVPYYDLNDYVLWGATAMITSELMQVVQTSLDKIRGQLR